MRPTKIKVCTVTCPKCGAEMYSRARHDFRACECGTFVDGGFDYMRCGWPEGYASPVFKTRYVYTTKQQLYDDWSKQQNKFGIVARKGA